MSRETHWYRPFGYMLASTSLLSMLAMPATQALAYEPSGSTAGSGAVTSNRSNAPLATSKHERVITTTDSSGNIRNIQVVTTLESNGQHDIADTSKLQRLTPSSDKVWASTQGELVWHSEDGKDITYTASSNAAPPVQVNVSYTLDGDDISPQDLSGQNGHVTIRYNYIDANKSANGYTPFAPFTATTSVVLDKGRFSDVSVTNGKLVEEDGKLIAFGCGVTGTQSGSTESAPTYFQIEADVRDFKLDQAVSVVSSDPLTALYNETKSLHGLSEETSKELDTFIEKLEDLRTHTDEARQDAENLANDLSIVNQVASQLTIVSSELDSNRANIDTVITTADNTAAQAREAENIAQGFIDSIYSMDSLSEDQKAQIIDAWNAQGVSSALAQVDESAQTVRDAGSQLSFANTIQSANDLRGIDFEGISQRGRDLSEKLRLMLEEEFSEPFTDDEVVADDDETIFGGITRLKRDLEEGKNDQPALSETLAGGLSSDVLLLQPQADEPDDSSAKQANSVKATVTKKGANSTIVADVALKIDGALAELAGSEDAPAVEKDTYTNYGGILDGTPGSVEFVFNTASIG